MTLSLPSARLAVPVPRLRSVPPAASSSGQEAVELAASAGLVLDEAQQLVLVDALGERPDGRWAAFEVGVCVARQNMKGALIEARELAGLFLLGERMIVHTAHQFDTALEAFRRVLQLIESTPDLDGRVARVTRSHGEEGIELKTGQRLRFKARTRSGGRGFTGDCVILDEAMILPQTAMSALMPTLSAVPNPQLWYLGSAVDRDEHPDGVVFSDLRRRATAGGEPDLCWLEWSSNEDPDDPRTWAAANPAVAAGRMSLEHIAKERRSMSDRAFRVERLSVDDYWHEPEDEGGRAFDLDRWASLADPEAPRRGEQVFGLAAAPDRSWCAVAVAWRRSDGDVQTVLVDYRPGTAWVGPRVAELRERWGGTVTADTASRGLAADAVEPGTDGQAQAHAALYTAVEAGTVRHGGEAALTTAVRAAKWKPAGDSRLLDRKGKTDVSPLVAVALAAHSLLTAPPVDVEDTIW